MLLLLLIFEFWPCCGEDVGSLCCMSFEFLVKFGDAIMDIASSESPSDNRFAGDVFCFSHMAYALSSVESDKVPSFIFAEPRLVILKERDRDKDLINVISFFN